jgi:hypothetical protein
MEINANRSKALSVRRARGEDQLYYSVGDKIITEATFCKYLGIIIRSDLSWADQVNYRVQKEWSALYFVIRIVEKGNKTWKV